MDILVPDKWLRDFLKTRATPKELAEYLSLCGPSVEKVSKVDNDVVYLIEVTTNRVDSASVYGIAREAAAILPRFGAKAALKKPRQLDQKRLKTKVNYLKVSVDKKLCPRFMAVLVKNVKIGESPNWIKNKLKLVGERPINNIVDISNFVMHELGQPVHTFDYDKIKGAKMTLRESRKGEKITTLDGKTHTLHGGDIVIADGQRRLIDLAGIMGGDNSKVDKNTKNVLLFVQTYNPVIIRRTSMGLAKRSLAAVLFEKGLDTQLVSVGMSRALALFEKQKIGKTISAILDIYPDPYKTREAEVSLEFINSKLGVILTTKEVVKTLALLGFKVVANKDKVTVQIPSFRAHDIDIPEDIVEEVARIYGYHNLPSKMLTGVIPDPLPDAPFEFENKVKQLLSGWGGVEVYTQSLVAGSMLGNEKALRLKNPLGGEGEYLRTSLMPSLINAANANNHTTEGFHLFEIANIYLPKKGSLPTEKMMLAGMFANSDYRSCKGIIEALFERLGIKADFVQEEESGFAPSKHVSVKSGNKKLGDFGALEGGYIYYEFDTELLRLASIATKAFKPIPKYPPQIEDITFNLPEKTRVGEVLEAILSIKLVSKAELTDTYRDSYTFRVWYQHIEKTLNDKEVTEIRKVITQKVQKKFGGAVKA